MKLQYFREPGTSQDLPAAAVRAGDFVFYSGGIAADPIRGVPEMLKPRPGFPYHGSSAERQVRYIYDKMAATLDSAGSSIKRIMKINAFHTNPMEIDSAVRVRKEYFGLEAPPPSTLLLIPETTVRGASVTTDVVALTCDAKLNREAFQQDTGKTPQSNINIIYGYPIFMQAVRGGGLIFTQGKGPSRKGAMAEEVWGHPDFPYRYNQIKLQTEIVLDYFKSLLEEQGSSLEHVVKAEVYLRNMRDISGLDEVWRRYFPTDPPARTIIPVGLAGADEMLIEVELVVVDPSGPYRKEVISVNDAPMPIGHESQATRAGPLLFLSGQLATDYKHGIAPEARVDPGFPYHSSSIKRQTQYILKNVETICRAAGTSFKNLVRRRAMHTDLREYREAEEVWSKTLGDSLPPTTTFRTAGPLPVPDCSVQYDLTAFIPGSLQE